MYASICSDFGLKRGGRLWGASHVATHGIASGYSQPSFAEFQSIAGLTCLASQ